MSAVPGRAPAQAGAERVCTQCAHGFTAPYAGLGLVDGTCPSCGSEDTVAPEDLRDRLRAKDVELGLPACASCGCTQTAACEGGCSWVSIDPPRCSACIPGRRAA